MIEITIKTEDEVALQKLLQFIKKIGLDIVSPTPSLVAVEVKNTDNQPKPSLKKMPKIQWAKEPEKAKDFFGVWKDNPMTPNQLKNAAWGGRLGM